MHIPGYSWCGPGTKVKKRLARNDPGVNGLDEACKEHDIAYANESDLTKRHAADEVLARKAMKRFSSKDASWTEKAASLGVAGVMKAKVKLGMGVRRRRQQQQQQQQQRAVDGVEKKYLLSNRNRCVKKLQKIKQELAKVLEHLNDSLEILQGNVINSAPSQTKQHTQRRQRKQQQQQQHRNRKQKTKQPKKTYKTRKIESKKMMMMMMMMSIRKSMMMT
nr:unnamed protein product [Callosobruchus chinensis]